MEDEIIDARPEDLQKISLIVAEVREFKSNQTQIIRRQDSMEVLLSKTVEQQNQTGVLLATLIEQNKQHGVEISEIKTRDVDVGKLLAKQEERVTRQEERLNGIWLVFGGAGSILLLLISAIAGHYIH